MSDNSRLHGDKDSFVGTIKENVGHTLGNERMEAAGAAQRASGNAEVEAVKAGQQAQGLAERASGRVKDAYGGLTGDSSLQAKGKLENTQGNLRQDLNK